MPSLRDKAHAGFLCTFSTRTSATAAGFAQKLAAEQLQTWALASGTVRHAGKAAWTVHHVQHKSHPGWDTLLQPDRRASVLGHLSSLGPHWEKSPPVEEIEIAIIAVLVDVRMRRWSHFQTTAKNVVFFANLIPCLYLCSEEVG